MPTTAHHALPCVRAAWPSVGLRSLHASAALWGGRNDSKKSLNPKLGYWIANQSKKAKKRHERQQESALAKAPKATPANPVLLNRALAVMKTDRTEAHRQYQLVIDGFKALREAPLTPRQRECPPPCRDLQSLALSHLCVRVPACAPPRPATCGHGSAVDSACGRHRGHGHPQLQLPPARVRLPEAV